VRLVIVAHSFPRWPGDVAGSFLARLAEALVARGHTVAVVAPADHGQAGRETVRGVEITRVRYAAAAREDLAYVGDMARRARSPSGALAFLGMVRALAAGVRDAVGRIEADLAHAFWWVPGGWAASGAPVPVVLSLMGTDVTLMRPRPARLLARRVLRRAAGVTALSTFLASEARRIARLPGLAIDRVPVPVDIGRFAGRSDGGGGVVYLGRLSEQKRVDLLLDAVHAAGVRAPVSIIGDGPARGELEARARTLGLDNVRFLGALPDDAVPSLVAAADVAAFPSRNEGLGLAAAEALLLGVPVVATTDGGGVLDLVTDGAGARIVSPDARAFGAALLGALSDRDLRKGAVLAGDRLRTELAPDAVARRFEQVYEAAVRRGAAAGRTA
jgi:glycosyltransferase involved in cell wall biosynthesis